LSANIFLVAKGRNLACLREVQRVNSYQKGMERMVSRRTLLQFVSAVVPLHAWNLNLFAQPQGSSVQIAPTEHSVSDAFPSHPPELVREMVTVAHFNLKRVQELVGSWPSLARAAWDWGFGDWEDALGAASHMGNRAIAEYLISKGARPSIFSATMLGELEVVKAFLAAHPAAQRIGGPHSISLLAHARMGGEAARPVLEFLQSLDGSDQDRPVSLLAEQAGALVGTYVFGRGPTEQIEVDADLKMYVTSKMYTYSPQLNWTRKGAMSRPLFHLGEQTFYPAGAPAVRIHFRQEQAALTLSVHDLGPIVLAHKVSSKS
jgi:hypothetical protein